MGGLFNTGLGASRSGVFAVSEKSRKKCSGLRELAGWGGKGGKDKEKQKTGKLFDPLTRGEKGMIRRTLS